MNPKLYPTRLLHTMLRVGDLEKSIAFYTQLLGMKLLRSQAYPEGEFTLAFVGYQDEADSTVLELTCNWGKQNTMIWARPLGISLWRLMIFTRPAKPWPLKVSTLPECLGR